MKKIERKLTIAEFVRRYDMLKTDEQKTKFIEDIMWRNYAPVLEKKLVLQTILNKSIITNDKGVSYIDYFLSKVNICFAIVILYTKLNVTDENEEKSSIYNDYDLLFERDLMNAICIYVGERELNELMSIHSVLIDNFETEFKSTEATILKYVDRFANIFGAFTENGMEHLYKILQSEDMKSNIVNLIKK